MAPEQARGKAIDKRVDIWAFGVRALRVLTGEARVRRRDAHRRPRRRAARASRTGPRSPPRRPPARARAARALPRERPAPRLRDVGDARSCSRRGSRASRPPPPSTRLRSPARVPSPLGPMFAIAGAAAGFFALRAPSTVSRAAPCVPDRLPLPVAATDREGADFPELSPDGRYLVMPGPRARGGALGARARRALQARRLEGTEDARSPFWSPDSRQIGFFAKGQLRKAVPRRRAASRRSATRSKRGEEAGAAAGPSSSPLP